jgi:hypothetical protein
VRRAQRSTQISAGVPQPAALLKVIFAVQTINKNCLKILKKETKNRKIRALLNFVFSGWLAFKVDKKVKCSFQG